MEINAIENAINLEGRAQTFQEVANAALQKTYTRNEVKFGESSVVPNNITKLKNEHPDIYETTLRYFSENIYYDLEHHRRRLREVLKENRQ